MSMNVMICLKIKQLLDICIDLTHNIHNIHNTYMASFRYGRDVLPYDVMKSRILKIRV